MGEDIVEGVSLHMGENGGEGVDLYGVQLKRHYSFQPSR